MTQERETDVVLVGRDKAPTLAGQMLEVELRKQGYSTRSFFGDGKPIGASLYEIEQTARYAGLVWVGMSSSAELAEPEIVAAHASHHLALYADIEGCQNRDWFRSFRQEAKLLFVLTEREKEKASLMYGSGVNIVATGNPTHEEFAFPRLSRAEARGKLDAADDETLIIVSGTKSVCITSFLAMSVVEAIHSGYMSPRTYYVAILPHPGDESLYAVVKNRQTEEEKLINPYAEIEQFSGIRVRLVKNNVISTPDAVAGADVFVEIAGTEGRRAAYQNIPVIDFFSVVGRNRMQAGNKVDTWGPCDLGMAIGLYKADIPEFARTLEWVLTPEGRAENSTRQKIACPPLQYRGAAVQAMVEAMRRYLP
ncbi:MAG: hypothetical protein AAB975_01015 [Patescibacteria group bacterium]